MLVQSANWIVCGGRVCLCKRCRASQQLHRVGGILALKTTCAIRELLGISCSLTLATLTQRKTESSNSFQGHRFQHVRTILYLVNALAYSTKAAITLSLVTSQEWTIMTTNHDGTCALKSCNASISKDNCLIKPRLAIGRQHQWGTTCSISRAFAKPSLLGWRTDE